MLSCRDTKGFRRLWAQDGAFQRPSGALRPFNEYDTIWRIWKTGMRGLLLGLLLAGSAASNWSKCHRGKLGSTSPLSSAPKLEIDKGHTDDFFSSCSCHHFPHSSKANRGHIRERSRQRLCPVSLISSKLPENDHNLCGTTESSVGEILAYLVSPTSSSDKHTVTFC